MIVTGIGSRRAPKDSLDIIEWCGWEVAANGWSGRSGGAIGCDLAFEKGFTNYCRVNPEPDGFINKNYENLEVYLVKKRSKDNQHITVYDVKYLAQAEEIAKRIHPKWEACDEYAIACHTRNVFQILGLTLDKPTDLVVCWTPDGLDVGGTRTAIVLARELNIKVLNMFNEKDVGEMMEIVGRK